MEGLEILEPAAGVAVKLSVPKPQVSGPEVPSVAGLLWWPFRVLTDLLLLSGHLPQRKPAKDQSLGQGKRIFFAGVPSLLLQSFLCAVVRRKPIRHMNGYKKVNFRFWLYWKAQETSQEANYTPDLLKKNKVQLTYPNVYFLIYRFSPKQIPTSRTGKGRNWESTFFQPNVSTNLSKNIVFHSTSGAVYAGVLYFLILSSSMPIQAS